MLNHGTVRISVPAGGARGWAMPASKALDEAKFYSLEELEEMGIYKQEEPKSTWPREKASEENGEDSPSESPSGDQGHIIPEPSIPVAPAN